MGDIFNTLGSRYHDGVGGDMTHQFISGFPHQMRWHHNQYKIFSGYHAGDIVGRPQVSRQCDARKKYCVFSGITYLLFYFRFKHPKIDGVSFISQKIGESRSPAACPDNTYFHVIRSQ